VVFGGAKRHTYKLILHNSTVTSVIAVPPIVYTFFHPSLFYQLHATNSQNISQPLSYDRWRDVSDEVWLMLLHHCYFCYNALACRHLSCV